MKYIKVGTLILLSALLVSCEFEEKDFIKPVPIALEATAIGPTAFKASWLPLLGANSYTLQVAKDITFPENGFVEGYPKVVKDTSYQVSNLEAGQMYYYRIKASKERGDTDFSNVIKAETEGLAAPAIFSPVNNTSTSFEAQWGSVLGAESYLFYLATDAGFTAFVEGYNGYELSDTTYTVSSLEVGKQYFYKVKAKRGEAVSAAFSDIRNTFTSDLKAPTLLPPEVRSATNQKVFEWTANWEAVSGADGYLLYVAQDTAFTQMLPALNGKAIIDNSYMVTGLEPFTTYYYRLQSKQDSVLSDFSTYATVNPFISATCRISERKLEGLGKEVFTYNASNRVEKIEVFVASVLLQNFSITYDAGGHMTTATKRKDEGAGIDTTEVWAYNYTGSQINTITKRDKNGVLIEHLKFVYDGSNRISELQKYNSTVESAISLINKEVYFYNAKNQVATVKDKDGNEIKRFLYNNAFNAEALFQPDLALLLYNASGGSNQPVIHLNDVSYYQYYDGSQWKSFSYVYEYNTKGVPVRVLGSGGNPDLVYTFENCGF